MSHAKRESIILKILENKWNIAGLSAGFITGISGSIINLISVNNKDELIIACTFIISFVAMLVYQFTHIDAFKQISLHHDEILRERDEALSTLKRLEDYNEKSAEAFQTLSEDRSKFDAAIIQYLLDVKGNARDHVHAESELNREYDEFLKSICNRAVEAIAGHKLMNREIFDSNIKIFYPHENGINHRYKVKARSNNATPSRRGSDKNDKTTYIVENNFIFAHLILPNNTKRYWYIPSIADEVQKLSNMSGDNYKEPTISSETYFKSCLCMLIRGDSYKDQMGMASNTGIKLNDQETAIGAIFIDSSEHTPFNDEAEIGIMEELAMAVYSATRFFDSAKEIARKDT